MNSDPIVFVIDDDRAVRESLEWLLGSAGLTYQSFDSAQAFLDLYKPGQAGCLVLDVRLPGMNGLDMHDEVVRRGGQIPTIVITGHGDVGVAVRAMKAGVIDFLEKPFNDRALLDRITMALKRDRELRRSRHRRDGVEERIARLTRRERQVMDLIVRGKLNKQIAAELKLSHKTIEVHRARVMKKMEAATLAELVRMAMSVEEPGSSGSAGGGSDRRV